MRALRSLLWGICLVCLLGLICYSGWNLWQIYQSYQEGKVLYSQLSDLAVTPMVPDASSSVSPSQTPSSRPAEAEDTGDGSELDIAVDFSLLQGVNPDVIAWIYGPDTGISYPVVQGQDNSYYLDHLLDGTYNGNGTIFLDVQCDRQFTDRNTILYGHHMKNGTMFAPLEQYREADYYALHPVFYLLTPDGNYRLELFSARVVPADDPVYQTQFASDEAFAQWLAQQRERSDLASSVQVTDNDRVVTLSTCAYDYEDARYVVLGKLVPLGD